MNTRNILLCLILTPSVQLLAMEKHVSQWHPNTYQGTPITANNLYELSIKPSTELHTAVAEWFGQQENKELVQTLLTMPACSSLEEIGYAFIHHQICLENKSIKNLARYNYVFNPENTNFIIRISGLINLIRHRAITLLHKNPFPDPEAFQNYDWKKATEDSDLLHQHTSCQAHYLRLKEIEPFLTAIKLVPTYLFPVTDHPQALCCDKNYFIIQELYNNKQIIPLYALSKEKYADTFQHLSEKMIRELFFVIKHAALWDIHSKLMVNLENSNELWIADYEQPNNSDGAYFFYKGPEGLAKYHNDANCGLGYIRDLLQQYAPKQYELWLELMKQDWEIFRKEMMQ